MKYVIHVICAFVLVSGYAQAQIFTPITAKELYPNALDMAKQELADDVVLVNVIFGRVEVLGNTLSMDWDTGEADGWVYRFYSPSLDSIHLYAAVETFLGPQVLSPPEGSVPAIPFDGDVEFTDPWIDSPAALESALNGGGNDFRAQNPGAWIEFAVGLELLVDSPIAPAGKYWLFEFRSDNDYINCGVYAETGFAYQCEQLVSVEGIPEAATFRLDAGYPNPVSLAGSQPMTISYGLNKRQDIRITLHDVLGNEIAVVYEGAKSAGEYREIINPRVFPASGLYFYRLETASGSATRKIAVVN